MMVVANSLITDTHDSTTATKAVIEAAKVDSADAELAQDRGAHDARLNSDIQVTLLKDLGLVFGEDLAQGDELGMASALDKSMSDNDCEKRSDRPSVVETRWEDGWIRSAMCESNEILMCLLTFMVMLVPFIPLAIIFPS